MLQRLGEGVWFYVRRGPGDNLEVRGTESVKFARRASLLARVRTNAHQARMWRSKHALAGQLMHVLGRSCRMTRVRKCRRAFVA